MRSPHRVPTGAPHQLNFEQLQLLAFGPLALGFEQIHCFMLRSLPVGGYMFELQECRAGPFRSEWYQEGCLELESLE